MDSQGRIACGNRRHFRKRKIFRKALSKTQGAKPLDLNVLRTFFVLFGVANRYAFSVNTRIEQSSIA